MKTRLLVLIALLLNAACASVGGGGGGTPPPTTPVEQVAAVQVFDFVRPDVALPNVAVTCNGRSVGNTNDDGYLQFEAITGAHTECSFEKEGYNPNTAAFRPQPQGPSCPQCGTLRASMTALVPPEPEIPSVPHPIQGRLRIQDGILFVDDTGTVLPTYAHAGDLFSVFVRDEHRARDQLNRVAESGYHGVRTWLNLGCGPNTAAGCTHGDYWKGREVGPDITPNYWGRLHDFFNELSSRKLRLVASQGDIGQLRDRRDFMQKLRAQADANPVIDWVDCGNEAWQTGEPDPAKLAECVGYFGGGRALRTLTDAPIYLPGFGNGSVDTFNRFSIPPADAFDIHSFRDGHSWDKRRHIWGYTYCGEGCPDLKIGIGSEGPGNGVRVSASANKHELDDEAMALLALASHIGRQAYVWFSGEGVILDRGLQGESGFYSVPKAVALLPKDLYTYQTTHHSGDSFRNIRVLLPKGEVRIDGRQHADGRFVYTIDGPQGNHSLQVARSFTGKLCNPATAQCEDVTKNSGDRLDVSFLRGRLFMGRVH